MQQHSMPSIEGRIEGRRHGINTGAVAALTVGLTEMPLRPM